MAEDKGSSNGKSTIAYIDPEDPEKKAKIDNYAEVGYSGLVQWSGRVDEEFLRDLRGGQGIRKYREMADNDAVIGAILFAIGMLMRQVEWRVEPVDESPEAQEVAEFIQSCTEDMSASWVDTLSSILSMLVYGWNYSELVYKMRNGHNPDDPTQNSKFDDGLIGWRKIASRSQDTLFKWEFDEDGGILGMWQQAPPTYELVYIPIQKALLFRTTPTEKNNPEGRSVLRTAYRSWYYKSRLESIEAIGAERDLAGLPVMWVPPSMLSSAATQEERTALAQFKEMVASIKRDEQEGLILPLSYNDSGAKRFDFTLLATGGRREFDTDKIISRYDQRIAMTVLADFILLGHEQVGSFALGSSKIDMFGMALGAWLDEIAGVINTHAIPRLLDLNGVQRELSPALTHAEIKRVDLVELGNYITALAGAGMPLFPSGELEEYLLSAGNLPENEGAEQVEQ